MVGDEEQKAISAHVGAADHHRNLSLLLRTLLGSQFGLDVVG